MINSIEEIQKAINDLSKITFFYKLLYANDRLLFKRLSLGYICLLERYQNVITTQSLQMRHDFLWLLATSTLTGYENKTVLMWAASLGQNEMVEWLVTAGADIGAETSESHCAESLAANPAIKSILQHAAQVQFYNKAIMLAPDHPPKKYTSAIVNANITPEVLCDFVLQKASGDNVEENIALLSRAIETVKKNNVEKPANYFSSLMHKVGPLDSLFIKNSTAFIKIQQKLLELQALKFDTVYTHKGYYLSERKQLDKAKPVKPLLSPRAY